MSKNNIALIVAGVLVLAGIFIFTTGLLTGGSSHVYIDSDGIHTGMKNTKAVIVPINSFNDIDIDVKSENIELIKSDRNEVEYCLSNGQNIKEFGVIDGKLSFKTDYEFKLSFFNFGFNENYVKVYYNSNTQLENVSLKSTSGSVEAENVVCDNLNVLSTSGRRELLNVNANKIINGGTSGSSSLYNVTAEEAILTNSSGSIKIDGMQVNSMSINNSSGSIKLEDIYADKVSVENSSGSISVDEIECTNDFTVKNSSGGIRLEDSNTKSLNIKTTSGAIYIDGTLTGESILKSSSASIKVYTDLSINNYGYILTSNSGSTRVNDEKFEGATGLEKANIIDASTTSGSIKIYFDEHD